MREAARYERRRLAEALALRRAELEAVRRREEHDVLRQLVKRACDGLPVALERRWRAPGTRREWCEAALDAAARHLCAPDWTIEIAPGLSREERDGLLARAVTLRSGTHTLAESGELRAGLTIRAAGAMLDASVTGMLAEPAAIEARLLYEWLRQGPRSGGAAAHA
jgi:hypothetical protein